MEILFSVLILVVAGIVVGLLMGRGVRAGLNGSPPAREETPPRNDAYKDLLLLQTMPQGAVVTSAEVASSPAATPWFDDATPGSSPDVPSGDVAPQTDEGSSFTPGDAGASRYDPSGSDGGGEATPSEVICPRQPELLNRVILIVWRRTPPGSCTHLPCAHRNSRSCAR